MIFLFNASYFFLYNFVSLFQDILLVIISLESIKHNSETGIAERLEIDFNFNPFVD